MSRAHEEFIEQLGGEIQDAEEETFLLFSQKLPSQNLGFVDSRAQELEVTIRDRELTIYQSPTILSSNRTTGTTGAVLWKITPLVAEWLSLETNFLRTKAILTPFSTILELGCGISGLIGLCVAPKIRKYIVTDQGYVMKILKKNIETNANGPRSRKTRKGLAKSSDTNTLTGNIDIVSLDWELDDVSQFSSTSDDQTTGQNGLDLVIACDCIYNEALIIPLVRTCADICRLRETQAQQHPTVCLIAQQLRSSDVLEAWLKESLKTFNVWRVPDEHLMPGLGENTGFVVHVAILKSQT